jgi:hypothetical protein
MKIIVVAFISLSILNANEVYNLSKEDYKLYENENKRMITVFKNQFLNKKILDNDMNTKPVFESTVEKKIFVKNNMADEHNTLASKYKKLVAKNKVLENTIRQNTILDDSTNKSSIFTIEDKKIVVVYDEKELISKLTIKEVQSNQNLSKYFESIDKILVQKRIQYQKSEIKNILELINKKELSDFESKLYLTQIQELIKG